MFDFVWTDDLAAARNAALSQATCDCAFLLQRWAQSFYVIAIAQRNHPVHSASLSLTGGQMERRGRKTKKRGRKTDDQRRLAPPTQSIFWQRLGSLGGTRRKGRKIAGLSAPAGRRGLATQATAGIAGAAVTSCLIETAALRRSTLILSGAQGAAGMWRILTDRPGPLRLASSSGRHRRIRSHSALGGFFRTVARVKEKPNVIALHDHDL